MARCQGARESGLERMVPLLMAIPHLARPDICFDCMRLILVALRDCMLSSRSLALPSVELGVGHIYISPITHRPLAGSGAAIRHTCRPGAFGQHTYVAQGVWQQGNGLPRLLGLRESVLPCGQSARSCAMAIHGRPFHFHAATISATTSTSTTSYYYCYY